jgi:hypothetical protein
LCPEVLFVAIIMPYFRYSENIAAEAGGTPGVIVCCPGLHEESSDNCKKPFVFTP